MQKILIILGIVLIIIGLGWPLFSYLKIGRLPGDIIIRKGNFVFYFPIMTCLIISLLWIVVSWFIKR